MKKHFLNIALWLISLLPLEVLRALGNVIGSISFKSSKRSANRLRKNLLLTKMADEANVEKLAKETAREAGKTLVEAACILWQRSKKHSAKFIVKAHNYNHVHAIATDEKAIVFLTPHIGNFEITLKYTAHKIKRKFTILYKPTNKKWLNYLMLKGRSADNIKAVPTNRQGVLSLVKDLRDGGIVGVLPDSVASQGDGVWVDFFGNKVFATTLAAKLTLMPDVSSFMVISRRVKGGFELDYIPFIPQSDDVASVVQQIYRMIEAAVLKAPTQYYWSYDRFRAPKHAPVIDNVSN